MLETLINKGSVVGQRQTAIEWKNSGKTVIGYFCALIPEEIISAAGALPFRIMGGLTSNTSKADACLPATSCSFCRSSLDLALNNQYEFIDGIVGSNSCLNMVRMIDAWQFYIKPKYQKILFVPREDSDEACGIYTRELKELITDLQNLLGVVITTEKLAKAIEAQNKTRCLLRRLQKLKENLSVPAKDILMVLRSAMTMPKEEFNSTLEVLLDDLERNSGASDDNGIRLLLSGSMMADPLFAQLIEDCGASIVADDLCLGSRYFLNDVEETNDPVEALAKRYLFKPPCARAFSIERRLSHMVELVRTFDISGIIYSPIKFCDLYLFEYPLLEKKLTEMGIPVFQVEREHTLTGAGQIRTRIEAFLETLI